MAQRPWGFCVDGPRQGGHGAPVELGELLEQAGIGQGDDNLVPDLTGPEQVFPDLFRTRPESHGKNPGQTLFVKEGKENEPQIPIPRDGCKESQELISPPPQKKPPPRAPPPLFLPRRVPPP